MRARVFPNPRALGAGTVMLLFAVSATRSDPSQPTGTAIPPWVSCQAANWANASSAIMLPDMTKVEPTAALSPRMKRRHWKAIPYELIGGQKGSMIWASPESDAPPVRLHAPPIHGLVTTPLLRGQ